MKKSLGDPKYEVVLKLAQKLKALQPDVIMSGNFNKACVHFGSPKFESVIILMLLVKALREVDYMPKALVMPLCIEVDGVEEHLDVRYTSYLSFILS